MARSALTKKTLWIATAALAAIVLLLQFCPASRRMPVFQLETSLLMLTVDRIDSLEGRLFVLGTLTHLPRDRGIWLVFDEAERPKLWSRNFQTEVDVLWLDDTRQIVDRDLGLRPCAGTDCPEYEPERFAVSALVLSPGLGRDARLEIGQTAMLRAIPDPG